MDDDVRLRVVFFKTVSGTEPVRGWLRRLERTDRKTIGQDITTVQFGWPLGMPLVRKLETELWEVRSQFRGRIARVLFAIQVDRASARASESLCLIS